MEEKALEIVLIQWISDLSYQPMDATLFLWLHHNGPVSDFDFLRVTFQSDPWLHATNRNLLETKLRRRQYFFWFHTQKAMDRKKEDIQPKVHTKGHPNSSNQLRKNGRHLLQFLETCTQYYHRKSKTYHDIIWPIQNLQF